jgi:hypothetical protein
MVSVKICVTSNFAFTSEYVKIWNVVHAEREFISVEICLTRICAYLLKQNRLAGHLVWFSFGWSESIFFVLTSHNMIILGAEEFYSIQYLQVASWASDKANNWSSGWRFRDMGKNGIPWGSGNTLKSAYGSNISEAGTWNTLLNVTSLRHNTHDSGYSLLQFLLLKWYYKCRTAAHPKCMTHCLMPKPSTKWRKENLHCSR